MGKYAEDYINEKILAPLLKIMNRNGDNDILDYELDEIVKSLQWKIKLIGNTLLYRKVSDMNKEVMRWYSNDSN